LRVQAFGMLADEAEDAAPVPERMSGDEAAVADDGVAVLDEGLRHVPALPARLRRSVPEVDVAVEPKALVEAAELFEHLAAQEQEGAEHPVGRDRLGGTLLGAASGVTIGSWSFAVRRSCGSGALSGCSVGTPGGIVAAQASWSASSEARVSAIPSSALRRPLRAADLDRHRAVDALDRD
jgi:hypothetical protein